MSEHMNYTEFFYEVFNIFLSSEDLIIKCCDNVLNEHIMNIRTKGHANHEWSIHQFWLMVVENAIKRTCRSIGLLIYNKISVHSKLKLCERIPCETYGNILFKATKIHIWDDICRYDHQLTNTRIGSKKWRKRIPDALYECLVHNGKKIASSFLDIFQETERDLKNLSPIVQDCRDRTRPPNPSDCKYYF